MRFTIDINLNIKQVQESDLLKLLNIINLKITNVPTKQEFQAALDEMSSSIDNIASDIQRLTEQLSQGGLSDADEADILSQLQAKAAQLKSIADQTPEPEPPVEPQP